jgi:hypothetical protein
LTLLVLTFALSFVGACILAGVIGYEIFEFMKSESELLQEPQKRTESQRPLPEESYSWQLSKLTELPVQVEQRPEQRHKQDNDHHLNVQYNVQYKHKSVFHAKSNAVHKAANNAANNTDAALYAVSWQSWFQIPRTPPITSQQEQSNASLHPPSL